MKPRRNVVIVVLSIAAIGLWLPVLAQKDSKAFRPEPASSYPSHQTTGGLKLAAVKYESDPETRPVFGGKLNPNEHGVLPVLLVVENAGQDTLRLDRMQVRYQTPDRQQIQPTDPRELPYLLGVRRPNTGPGYPSPIPLPKRRNLLTAVELETRAWAARTLLKGETAHGFFYFQVRHRRNSLLYVTGIREAATGNELFFVEIPIDPATPE